MAKFNLNQLLSERSRMAAEKQDEQQDTDIRRETPAELEQVMLDIHELIPSEENFYSVEDIEELKKTIALVGILQPLLVRKKEDKYYLKAGHRRRMACLSLLGEGYEQYRYVPCVVREEEDKENVVNQLLDRLTLIFANSFREKSDWEKMEEVLQTEALIQELRKEVSIEGRTRTVLAQFMGIKETQIARYKAIKNHLSKELMELFKAGKINMSTAYELSGLSDTCQTAAAKKYKNDGGLSINDAKGLKRKEEEENKTEIIEVVDEMDTEALDMMAESEMGDRIMGEEQQAQSRSASMEKTSYPAEDKKKPSEEKIKKDLEEVKEKEQQEQEFELDQDQDHKEPAAYDEYILREMIANVEGILREMGSYWKENQPRTYTKHVMELVAYKNLLELHT